MKTRVVIFLILSLCVIGGAFAYFFFLTRPDKGAPAPVEHLYTLARLPADLIASTSSVPTTLPSVRHADEKTPEQFREYRNAVRGFSLHYPKELSVKEYNEEGGAYTIVFENPSGDKSFQIFFTPYFGDAITQSRIVKDIPSGKFSTPIEIIIGADTRALSFFSESELGQMREVWFLHDGFLYEITTYQELDGWLANIMRAWKWL